MNTANFKFSGNFGDVIGALPAMKKYYELFGKKVILYSHLNRKAIYYAGATHPTVNDEDKAVMMNGTMLRMIRPLLLQQEYIADYKAWDGEDDIKVDLDRMYQFNVGKPYGSLNRWAFYLYPNLATDLSKAWLTIPDSEVDLAMGKILLTRSSRYTHPFVNYYFLRPYENEIMFVGTESEHEDFCNDFKIMLKHLKVDNFLTLAQAIKQCRFYMSNQTGIYQIAEGMKKPRILEMNFLHPNVIPIGEDAFDSPYEDGLKFYFDYLYEKTKQQI